MRQIWITGKGDVDVLRIREAPAPEPGPGEVRISVRGIGVNFADIMARMGLYPEAPPLPFVPGYEVAGVVERCGPGASLAPGARVMALTRFGGYATTVCVPATQVSPLPDAMTFEQGAALGVAYLTAHLAVVHCGHVEPGERVLIHNAGGGLGLAAVQLALARGATVLGTASRSKHDRLREAGVQVLVDPRTDDVAASIGRASAGRGVDLIVNSVGGTSVRRDLDILAPLGRLVLCGVSSSAPARRYSLPALLRLVATTPRPALFGLMNRNHGVFGLNLGRLWSETERLQGTVAALLAMYGAGQIQPVIARVFPFEEAAAAHAYIQDRQNFGKVVLAV
jgi:NADPH:quinone reductase-like Zn-dependent oxidoreductase